MGGIGEIIFAHHEANVNAEDWISLARRALVSAVSATDHVATAPILRHRYRDSQRAWASFGVPRSSDVFWVAQVDGEAPSGSYVVHTEHGDWGVWRHPNDPALPGLRDAVTPGALRQTLASIAPEVDSDAVDIVTLEPLQRATVRVGEVGNAVYVKVLPPWRVATVADAHRRAATEGLPTPPLLHADVEHGLLVLGVLPGRPLAEHLELGRPVPDADQIWDLVRRVTAALGAHGDLHDRQILVDESGHVTGLVDLDDVGGNLLDDLAGLIAHVTIRGDTHHSQRDRVITYVGELRSTFARHVDDVELERRIEHATSRLHSRLTAFSNEGFPARNLPDRTDGH